VNPNWLGVGSTSVAVPCHVSSDTTLRSTFFSPKPNACTFPSLISVADHCGPVELLVAIVGAAVRPPR